MRKYLLAIFIGTCLGAITQVAFDRVQAQERPVRPLRGWQLGWLPALPNDGADPTHRLRVDVIDTEGVCLYVVSGGVRERGDRSGGTGIAIGLTRALTSSITAVPKTQLPKGTGCQ